MVVWIAAILLITAVALFIAAPLTDPVSRGIRRPGSTISDRRDHEHALAVQALRELEFDRAMGKLDPDDYSALRQKLEARALASMGGGEKMPKSSSPDRSISSPQSDAAPPITIVNYCFQCGDKFTPAHNFCPNCGAARPLTALGAGYPQRSGTVSRGPV